MRVLLAVWVFIWVAFLARPYFKKDLGGEYSALLSLSAEGKRAYVTGRDLYSFLKFCNNSLTAPSTYVLKGLKDPLDERRAAYYLYPNTKDPSPEFLFIYGVKDYSQDGYRVFKKMNEENYILKRVKNG